MATVNQLWEVTYLACSGPITIYIMAKSFAEVQEIFPTINPDDNNFGTKSIHLDGIKKSHLVYTK